MSDLPFCRELRSALLKLGFGAGLVLCHLSIINIRHTCTLIIKPSSYEIFIHVNRKLFFLQKYILTAYLIDFRKTDIWSSKLIWDTEFFKKKIAFFNKVDRYEKHKQYACAHQRSFTVIQYT